MSKYDQPAAAFEYRRGSQVQSVEVEVETPDGDMAWGIVNLLGLSSRVVVTHTLSGGPDEQVNQILMTVPPLDTGMTFPPIPADPAVSGEPVTVVPPVVDPSPRIMFVGGTWRSVPVRISSSVPGAWVTPGGTSIPPAGLGTSPLGTSPLGGSA